MLQEPRQRKKVRQDSPGKGKCSFGKTKYPLEGKLENESRAENQKALLPFATAWIKLESIMLSEISQAVRDKYHMISPLTGT